MPRPPVGDVCEREVAGGYEAHDGHREDGPPSQTRQGPRSGRSRFSAGGAARRSGRCRSRAPPTRGRRRGPGRGPPRIEHERRRGEQGRDRAEREARDQVDEEDEQRGVGLRRDRAAEARDAFTVEQHPQRVTCQARPGRRRARRAAASAAATFAWRDEHREPSSCRGPRRAAALLGDGPAADDEVQRRAFYEQAPSRHACARPHSAETWHCGAASCAVTQTPARQYGPEEPAQQSASAAHGVRHTAFTHARPGAQSVDAWHCGQGPRSG